MVRRMTTKAMLAPMHSTTATTNAAEEKAGAVWRNFQHIAKSAISWHPQTIKANRWIWSANARFFAELIGTNSANQQSHETTPR
jgi:hypothetical protein